MAKTFEPATARKAYAQSGPAGLAAQGGPGRRARPGAAERREAILAAALDEFSARGFARRGSTTSRRRAGVAKGTIYLYFADKETLFQELCADVRPVVGALETCRPRTCRSRDIIERMIDMFVRRSSARAART